MFDIDTLTEIAMGIFKNAEQCDTKDKSKVESKPYRIPTIEGWQRIYESKLSQLYGAAGHHIQGYFRERGINEPDFRWIQTSLTYPAFQHFCFAYCGNIYSILIEFVSNNENYIFQRDVKNQIRECKKNDLIPCIIQLDLSSGKPLVPDTHLISTQDRTPISFIKREGDVKMSPWEINSFAVSIVLQYLKKEGNEIINYTDILSFEPNIWFYDKKGNRCYVIVKAISGSTRENLNYKINQELLLRFPDCDGYFAEVGISPSDAVVYDDDGNIIPLSKRFQQDNPIETLYRDHGFYINFKGLKYIERQAAEKGAISTPIYDIPAGEQISHDELVFFYAEAWKRLDANILEPFLDEDFTYKSQWVAAKMSSKNEYISYLKGKFEAIKKSGSKINVSISESDLTGLTQLQLVQDGRSYVVIDVKTNNEKIISAYMHD